MRAIILGPVWIGLLLGLMACAGPSVSPAEAQRQAAQAWAQAQHGTFTLTWPQAPLSGPVIFEAWFTANRQQRRFEILQAPTPALVGLVYLSDGVSAGYANRLSPGAPATGAATLPFSPLSDALAVVDRWLVQPAQSARQSGHTLTLLYPAGEKLTLTLNPQTGLITFIALSNSNEDFTLTTPDAEPLGEPLPGLFTPNFPP